MPKSLPPTSMRISVCVGNVIEKLVKLEIRHKARLSSDVYLVGRP